MSEQEKAMRVCITATQRVHFKRYAYMTPAQWAVFKLISREAHMQKDLRSPDRNSWLDYVNDFERAEDVDGFTAIVVDEDGEPVEPRDEYTGKKADAR